jgi:hypothetical protein
MNDIAGLIEYLSASRPLILFGAGASAGANLPTWSELAERLLDKMRITMPSDIEPLEETFAKQDYPRFFGQAETLYRSLVPVCSFCQEQLVPKSQGSSLYPLLAQIPARGYLTTNYESLLHQYFTENRLTSKEFLNSAESLSAVDFERPRSIVKLHGDLSHPTSVVLTDRHYQEVLSHPKFQALRAFTSAHLHTSRLLFIGYSFRDPDLQFLLSEAAGKLRRKVPLYGILANTSEEEAEELYEKYNLKVLHYRAMGRDHSELVRLLKIVASYFSSEPHKVTDADFRAAQSLYMWHKMKSADATEATKDALQAIILGTLADGGGEKSKAKLLSSVSAVTAVSDSNGLTPALDAAVKALIEKGFVRNATTGDIAITSQGLQVQKVHAAQFANLRSAFEEQIAFDLQDALPKASDQEIDQLQKLVHEALIQIFVERGVELADSAFSNRFETRSSLDLLTTINAFTAVLPDRSRSVVFAYLMELITHPRSDQRAYIEFLAKAFFVTRVVGIDPEGASFRKLLLDARTVIIDANIMIPAMALKSAKYKFYRDCLNAIRSAGIHLITIEPFSDEVVWHFQWAEEHVRKFGPQSIEVLECAIGSPAFRRNEGIDGFVRTAADTDLSMDEYLSKCFGGPPSYENIKAKIASLGIEIYSLNEIAAVNPDVWVIQSETEKFIADSQVGLENPKSSPRIRGESYAYAICHDWEYVKPENSSSDFWQCSLLSQGMSLNKVAKSGPYPIQRPLVIRPDALQEAIKAFMPAEQTVTVSESMLATYVFSAEHFIDKQKYAEFFRPLINDAESVYKENLVRLEAIIENDSYVDLLDGYEELDKPLVVDSLRRIATIEGERRLAESRKAFDEAQALSERERRNLQMEVERNAELARRALAQLSPNARKRLETEMKKELDKPSKAKF